MSASARTKLLAVAVAAVVGALAPATASAAPGDLDPSFGTAGTFIEGPDSSESDPPSEILALPGGRIMIAAWRDGAATVVRMTRGGAIDRETRISLSYSYANSDYGMVRLRSGKVMVAMLPAYDTYAPPPTPVLFARLTRNGGLDRTFGDGSGVVVTDLTVHTGDLGLARAPGGRLVVSTGPPFGGRGFLVARFLRDGSPDPSFGDGGSTLAVSSLGVGAAGLVVLDDGRVRVGGEITGEHGYGPLPVVLGLREDGSLDLSYGGGGIARLDPNYGQVSDLAPASGGRLAVVGSWGTGTDLAILSPAGEVERTTTLGSGLRLGSIAAGRHGELAAAGRLGDSAAVAMFDRGGTPVPSFGDDGVVKTALGSDGSTWTAITIQRNGKLITAGVQYTDYSRGGTAYELAAARYEVGASPGDADGDGFLDRRDRCPSLAGLHHHGCPAFARTLTLAARGGGFVGQVDSLDKACERAANVRVLQALPGRDRSVGVDRGPRHGRFTVDAAGSGGRYYAVANRDLVPGTGLCKAARSRIVHASR